MTTTPRTLRWAAPAAAFIAGLVTVAWVGLGPMGASRIAGVIVALIGGAYIAGGFELLRFARATEGLQGALQGLSAGAAADGWVARLDPSLHNAVRQRAEGLRVALPGPALTPTLVGLLVLLGMLGTFIGMVVTLDGAVQAMQGSADLATMRAALAAPVKGLGLAFGTSVAGVAASAMLGLASALLRRDRAHAGQQLDTLVATTLRPATQAYQQAQARREEIAQQREDTQATLQALQALAAQMDRRDAQWHEHQARAQASLQAGTQAAFSQLAASVEQTLTHSLAQATQAASTAIEPALASTMQQMARETAAFQQRAGEAVAQQLEGMAGRFDQAMQGVTGQWEQAQAALLTRIDSAQTHAATEGRQHLDAWAAALKAQIEQGQASWQAQQRDSSALLSASAGAAAAAAAELARWRDSASEAQHAQALAAAEALRTQREAADTAQRVQHEAAEAALHVQREAAEAVRMASTQLGGGAAEVSALAEVLLGTVRQFAEANAALLSQLQRIETALTKSAARSDEQLAFYVAQARELVDLSIASQQQVTGELQRLAQAAA